MCVITENDQPLVVGGIHFKDKHQAKHVVHMLDDLITDVVIMAAPNVGTIETSLNKLLNGKFDITVQQAVQRALGELKGRKGPLTQNDAKLFNRIFDTTLDTYPEKVRNEVLKATGLMYNLQRAGFSDKLKVAPNFNLVDSEAIDWMRKDNMHWIGNFYGDNLQTLVHEDVNNTMLTQGLSREEAARELQHNLANQIRNGTLPAAVGVPPPGWRGPTDLYFEGLTANAATRATTWANLETFATAGVEVYRIDAVLDERTSEICRLMNGKEFSVPLGLEQRDKVLNSVTPGGVKAAAGWMSAGDASQKFGISAGALPSTATATAMAEGGLAFPPYHFHCRTIVVTTNKTWQVPTTGPAAPPPPRANPIETRLLEADPRLLPRSSAMDYSANETKFYEFGDSQAVVKPMDGG